MTEIAQLDTRQTRHRVCLVHYHEIGLKGHNRKKFEQQLIANIEALIKNSEVRIRRISGRICLFLPDSSTYEDSCRLADQIAGVPGIARVSCGYRCAQDLEEMYETACMALTDAGDFIPSRFKHDATIPILLSHSMQLNQLWALLFVVLSLTKKLP